MPEDLVPPETDIPDVRTITCPQCNREYSDGRDEESIIELLDTIGVCDMCAYTCGDCGEQYDGDNAYHAFAGDYCESCAENYASCDHCDDVCHRDELSYLMNLEMDVCGRCLNNRYWYCDSCEMWFGEDDNCDCDSDDPYDSDRLGRDAIHGYMYKPAPLFRRMVNGVVDARFAIEPGSHDDTEKAPKHLVFMGFELECESMGAGLGNGTAIMQAWTLPEIAYLKHDGSLNKGMEIVSHPATLDYYHQLDMAPLQQLRDIGFRSWDAGTCGIHVHVSRNAFNGKAHMWRFARLILGNEVHSTRLAGRRDSHWSAFGRSAQRAVHGNLTKGEWSDRYLAVNLQNDHTVEIRMFRGSLNSDRLLTDLEFVDACVEYTRTMTLGEIRNGALDWQNFATYVQVNGIRYAHLVNHVHIESDDVMYIDDNA